MKQEQKSTSVDIMRANQFHILLVCFWISLLPSNAMAYVPDDPWTVTASGTVASEGSPATVTWSIAPDGTSIPDAGSSNLISYFDSLFNESMSSSDLTQRSWYTYLEQSFDRWSELGGIEFIYEDDDDGVQLQNFGGSLNVRGDIRLAGAFTDGPSGTLAYATLPNSGDIVFDTGETSFYSNSSNNYRQFRNTLMHEIGHAFGLLHVESSSDGLLLEPFIDTSFDGPQLDDIRGLHGLYGDFHEKSNNGQGNETFSLATDLGSLSAGGELSVGSDANISDQAIASGATDFVSIANSTDTDFFSFTINSGGLLDISLTPLGGVFMQGVEGGTQSQFDANARNDLSFSIYDSDGTTLLAEVDDQGLGTTESLTSLTLDSAGEYFISVEGSTDSVQLFELALSLEALPGLAGDFNDDGSVDGADYLQWARGSSLSFTELSNWQSTFGMEETQLALASVPEPSAAMILLTATIALCSRRLRPEILQ